MVKKKNYYSNIYIDICSICGGLWLDTGEFALLYNDKKKDFSIQDLLKEEVGKYIDFDI